MSDDTLTEDPCALVLEEADYDTGLHVGALFIIMGCSFLGTMLPIVGRKITSSKLYEVPFWCGKMFGCGVILATALVHMLAPADAALTNPCLPATFTEDYGAFAPASCLFAIVSMHILQFLISREIRREFVREVDVESPKSLNVEEQGHAHSHDHAHSHGSHGHAAHDHSHGHDLLLRKEKHIGTYILEIGIASHSVIIGVTLGVTRDPEFHTLIIALVFHQFFEGLALSTVVLDSKFQGNFMAILMVTFYTLTTPVGVAIGIGINSSFNANSTDALIGMGILDALSAGILLYDGLVNILNPHFKSKEFLECTGKEQAWQVGAFVLGAGIMAFIGRYA